MAQGAIASNPRTETARLAALRGLQLLDSAPSATFDRRGQMALG